MSKIFFILACAVALEFVEVARAQTQPAAAIQPEVAPLGTDDLPDGSLHGDIFAVVVTDLEKGDRTAWFNAWAAISGGTPSTRPIGPNTPLPIGADQLLGPLFKVGVVRADLVYSLSGGDMVVCTAFRLAPGADEKKATSEISKFMRIGAHFEHDGPWLINRIKAQSGMPVSPDNVPLSPRADEIRQDLNCWGADVPVKILYLSSEKLKNKMANNPPPYEIEGMVEQYWKAKYLYIGLRLGPHPSVQVNWIAPDAAGADLVAKEFENSRQRLKRPGSSIPIPLYIVTAFDQYSVSRQDNVASLSLSQTDLTNIFRKILTGMMSQQNQNQNPQQIPPQTPVATDWEPTDAATDSATAQMRLILSAIRDYDRDHQALPATLNDLVTDNLVPGKEIFHNPRTGKDDGFIYKKPDGVAKLSDITTPAKPAILHESKDGAIDPNGLVGYADGHVGIAAGH